MRNRIRNWLIDLANKIGTKEYYQFGEEIRGMVEHKGELIVFTEKQIYKHDGKKFKNLE